MHMSASEKAYKACQDSKDEAFIKETLLSDIKSLIQIDMVNGAGVNVLWDANGVGLLVDAKQKIRFIVGPRVTDKSSSKAALLSAYDKLKSGAIKLDADGKIIFDETSTDENGREQYKGIVLLKPSHGRYSFDFMNPTKLKKAKSRTKKTSSNVPSQAAPTTQATTPPVHVVSGAIDPNTGICQHCGACHG